MLLKLHKQHFIVLKYVGGEYLFLDMIKRINHQNFIITPFTAIKSRDLCNIDNNDNCILTEDGDYTISLDYVDYTFGTNPILNSECNIVLEQQESDQLTFEEGISGSIKSFDPNVTEQNTNGSYKILLYDQIYRSFYNNYKNPTEIFGMENIDFPLSKTNRWLADNFRVFTIPQKLLGDRIVKGSIQFYDNTFDDNVDIYDDTEGNLIAGNNLFSKVQKVRTLGNFVMNGTSSYSCPTLIPHGIPTITAIQT